MKRGKIGMGLLAGILALCVLTGVYLRRQHAPMARSLAAASELAAAGEWEEAKALAQRVRGKWEARWHSVAALVDHKPMEEIDDLFRRLETYEKTENPAAFAVACRVLSGKMEGMADAHALRWWNFL